MNDSASHQQQQQREQVAMQDFDFGEYIANAASNDSQPNLDIYADFSQQQRNHAQMNLDPNITAQTMLPSQNRTDHIPHGQPQSIISAEMLNLKGRLEQQMKLQQLQQLILQQQVHSRPLVLDASYLTSVQIELLSGQPSVTPQKDAIFHGLLTPGPSAELPAIVPKDMVPPMMLQSAEMFSGSPSATVREDHSSPPPPLTSCSPLSTSFHRIRMSSILLFQLRPHWLFPTHLRFHSRARHSQDMTSPPSQVHGFSLAHRLSSSNSSSNNNNNRALNSSQ